MKEKMKKKKKKVDETENEVEKLKIPKKIKIEATLKMLIKNHHLTSTNNQYDALLRDPKLKDDNKHLFRGLDLDESKIAGLISPEGNGNCGFRAVSLSVYGNQGQWTQVKKGMLAVYNKYRDTLKCMACLLQQ
ncbi:hypothetical protein BD770DRAFT_378692 [Pilaira anomala]|nr:hypothetical protein BD770DRAFT_378692 [Pilaira anomala]